MNRSACECWTWASPVAGSQGTAGWGCVRRIPTQPSVNLRSSKLKKKKKKKEGLEYWSLGGWVCSWVMQWPQKRFVSASEASCGLRSWKMSPWSWRRRWRRGDPVWWGLRICGGSARGPAPPCRRRWWWRGWTSTPRLQPLDLEQCDVTWDVWWVSLV